ncbi:carbohydrate ABC transporter permease [Butyrivibrio fibrisolvens]|uniref:carbohydrate ABC transporter permease n=1 Tax=Butyrivibrio fibrisolvens TaxID=831 RepID=UPI0003B31DBA|nr:sugar ABC transporter permease [Butyrivibrio fibrisolvens]
MKAIGKLNDLLSANARQKTAKINSKNHTKSPSQPKYLPVRLKDMAISFLFIVPSLIGVVLFFGAPFAVVVFYSLVDNPTKCNFVGTLNFTRVMDNSAFQKAALHTIEFSAIAVPLAVVLSLLLAIVLENKIPGRSAFRSMFLSPMMVPIASIVLIWQVLFHYNGLVNQVMGVFGADKIDWLKSDQAHIVIIALFLWKNLGYNMILFMAALSSVPEDQLEVARLENANAWQTFWYVKLRYLSSTIVFVALMSLINSFKVFREIYLMTGDYPYDTLYILQHYMNNKFRNLDYQDLSAAAILMSVIMVILVAALFAIEERFGKDVENS